MAPLSHRDLGTPKRNRHGDRRRLIKACSCRRDAASAEVDAAEAVLKVDVEPFVSGPNCFLACGGDKLGAHTSMAGSGGSESVGSERMRSSIRGKVVQSRSHGPVGRKPSPDRAAAVGPISPDLPFAPKAFNMQFLNLDARRGASPMVGIDRLPQPRSPA
jgi:hypothetical protein